MAVSRSAGLRRLMREAAELHVPTDMYFAQPIEDNLFEWHFTIRGPPDSSYDGGVYHGRITLPHDYPIKPPSLMMLTPNGRFETNTKICLSISDYHPETWLPSWSIGTALVALIAFMSTPSLGAVGSIETSDEVRRTLAKKCLTWSCNICGCTMQDHLNQMKASSALKSEASKIAEVSQSTTDLGADVSVPTSPILEHAPIVENDQPTTTQRPNSVPSPTAADSEAIPEVAVIQPFPAVISSISSSSAGFLIFFFSAIFFALLLRRLKMLVS